MKTFCVKMWIIGKLEGWLLNGSEMNLEDYRRGFADNHIYNQSFITHGLA
jgi:hypothetical protein